jgi:hypothetical protein
MCVYIIDIVFFCVRSGNNLATVTNTTVELLISEHVFGSVYGQDGTNLDRIIEVTTYTKTKGIIVVVLWTVLYSSFTLYRRE